MESIQQLHAYWRMEYIEAPKPLSEDENIFLNIPKAENDEDVYLLHRGKLTYIVLNRYPYNAGHLLEAPYRQAPTLNDLSPEERADFMDNIILAQDILSKAIKPDGFNTGFNFGSAAGAGVRCLRPGLRRPWRERSWLPQRRWVGSRPGSGRGLRRSGPGFGSARRAVGLAPCLLSPRSGCWRP